MLVVGDDSTLDKVFGLIQAILGTSIRRYKDVTADKIDMCARAISGTSTPEEVAANGFRGSWSTELKVAVNSLAYKIANCPATRKLEHDVIVEPCLHRPGPAGPAAASGHRSVSCRRRRRGPSTGRLS